MILDEIVTHKKIRLTEHKKRSGPVEMRRLAENYRGVDQSFFEQLKKPGISMIGEFKKASPSLGTIRDTVPLPARTADYNALADAVSCLTEEDYFHGNVDDLVETHDETEMERALKLDAFLIGRAFMEAKQPRKPARHWKSL